MDAMCGRYSGPPQEPIIQAFDVQVVTAAAPASANVCPTQEVSIVADTSQPGRRGPAVIGDADATVRELRTARWGLVPSWSRAIDPRRLLINARSETVTEKPSFRAAAAARRAIVPAMGYYEWAAEGSLKVPYFLHPDDDAVIGFAGLYEWWHNAAADDWLCSMTIITRPATDALGHIHDRMPVVVPAGLVDDWLSPSIKNLADVETLLAAMPDPVLVPVPAPALALVPKAPAR